jgi:hypothetical protein
VAAAIQARTGYFCQGGVGSAEGGLESREQSEIFGIGFECERRLWSLLPLLYVLESWSWTAPQRRGKNGKGILLPKKPKTRRSLHTQLLSCSFQPRRAECSFRLHLVKGFFSEQVLLGPEGSQFPRAKIKAN